jgi:polyvinyl alcohol dehydrogenase (cytochrome)
MRGLAVSCVLVAYLGIASAHEPGSLVYRQHCAACHEAGDVTHAPSRAALGQTSPEFILRNLQAGGAMEQQGQSLTGEERRTVARYLSRKEFGAEIEGDVNCSHPAALLSVSDLAGPSWNGWGANLQNWRYQSASVAGLTAADVPKLTLKWAYAFPGAQSAKAQPAVVAGRLFIGSAIGKVYSLDARTGCEYWSYATLANVRTAIELAAPRRGSALLAYFGDLRANVYAVDANSGRLVWRVNLDADPTAHVTAAVKVHQGVVYVPVLVNEDVTAVDAHYPCCKTSGAVVALDAATGKQIWRTTTIRERVRRVGVNRIGVPTWGPSGAGVWNSPTLDPERGRLYVGTGDNHSLPATATSDAVLALDMKSGRIVWVRQFIAGDTFNTACMLTHKDNCPDEHAPDFDVSSSPMLVRLRSGARALIVGQKSGFVHAIDPDRLGAILWQTRVAKGGLLGGIEWGLATDGEAAFAPISDVEFRVLQPGEDLNSAALAKPAAGGGLVALNIETGQKLWSAAPLPCEPVRGPCSPAHAAAVTAIPGVVFSGSLDGHLRAYSTKDGAVLWDFDTKREFDAVGGRRGHGGTLNGPGPVIVDGILYVTSGYDVGFDGQSGNMLLAFEPQLAQHGENDRAEHPSFQNDVPRLLSNGIRD